MLIIAFKCSSFAVPHNGFWFFFLYCKGSPGSGGSGVEGPKGEPGERVSHPNFSLSELQRAQMHCLQLPWCIPDTSISYSWSIPLCHLLSFPNLSEQKYINICFSLRGPLVLAEGQVPRWEACCECFQLFLFISVCLIVYLVLLTVC